MEELRKLREEAKLKKGGAKEESGSKESALPSIRAPALPPVMMHRKGQFEMIPDFLKGTHKEINAINEKDMLQEALDKQQLQNQDSGLSMKELFEKKRLENEKKLKEAQGKSSGPSKSEVEERKARLLAARDLMRKKKEEER
mmetsp:Transcript_1494/g.2633  ORF Transcript_1494/g.2633 Transcript_1494/m.2633 type:complete len:142 (+) Transcript_1494:1252-1677(+)